MKTTQQPGVAQVLKQAASAFGAIETVAEAKPLVVAFASEQVDCLAAVIWHARGQGPLVPDITSNDELAGMVAALLATDAAAPLRAAVRCGEIIGELALSAFAATSHGETPPPPDVGAYSISFYPLGLNSPTHGLLSFIYAQPLDEDTLQRSAALATYLALACEKAANAERVANLQRALHTNRRIGMAVGILMATRHLTDDRAFDLLRTASQDQNRKLVEIADEVALTGLTDGLSPWLPPD